MALALIAILTFGILVFFLTSIAVFVTRNRNYRNAHVVVTTATNLAPVGYAATQNPVGSTTITSYNTTCRQQGYFTHATVPMAVSQPITVGVHPNQAPLHEAVAANMNPPSYSVAVGSAPSKSP